MTSFDSFLWRSGGLSVPGVRCHALAIDEFPPDYLAGQCPGTASTNS
jgi:hypothetical protein